MNENDSRALSLSSIGIILPALGEYAPTLERLFGNGNDNQISVPLSLLRDELIVLKAQLKAMIGQLALEQKKIPNFPTKNNLNDLPKMDEEEEQMMVKTEYPVRIVAGEVGELGTLIFGMAGSGHKRLFKSRPSSQSRQRGPIAQNKQPINVISPSTFWSFIENSGYFKEIGEEDLSWLETSEDVLAAVSGGIPPLGNSSIAMTNPPVGLVERLLSCLMDESKGDHSTLFFPINTPNIRTGPTGGIITQRRRKPWDGLYERILWDLRLIGICGPINTDEDMSNEICAALRKLQSELALLSKNNVQRKEKLYQLITSGNYLSALEYYRVLDDLDRGIEVAYSRRLAASVGTHSSSIATGALVASLNKKALLMRAFKHSGFPRRSKMIQNLGFAAANGNYSHQSTLINRIANGPQTPLGRLLVSTPMLLSVPDDSLSASSHVKSEKRRKKNNNK